MRGLSDANTKPDQLTALRRLETIMITKTDCSLLTSDATPVEMESSHGVNDEIIAMENEGSMTGGADTVEIPSGFDPVQMEQDVDIIERLDLLKLSLVERIRKYLKRSCCKCKMLGLLLTLFTFKCMI